jgi:hypothetical protein
LRSIEQLIASASPSSWLFYQLYPSGSSLGSPENAARILTALRTKSGSRKILTAPRTKLGSRKILTAPRTESASTPAAAFPPNLGWAHYRVLLNVANDDARAFYEIEAAREGWSSRELERQVGS